MIVFGFYSFEGSKTHFTGEANIYMRIYWVLLWFFDAINASNQRIICSCMVFQPSCFILYFIFSINFVIFYEIFYNDVTHFLTDSNENCTAYVKLNSKIFLFVELFWFSQYLLRKLWFITKIPSIVQLPYTSPSSPMGRPLRWVLLGTYLSHTWGYLKKKKVFYQKWWKPGSVPIIPPLWPPIWGGASTRSPLIFWDTFPP